MYTFTNHFSKSDLKSRIGMINQQRSTWWRVGWRYGFILMLLSGLLIACQSWFNTDEPVIPKRLESFLAKDGDVLYWVIPPSITDKTLDELQQALQEHDIAFNPDVFRNKKGRILRLEANLIKYKSQSSEPADSLLGKATIQPKNNFIASSHINAGSYANPRVLPALGFWYDPDSGFHSDVVTNDFPKALKETADSQSFSVGLDKVTNEDIDRLREFERRNAPGVSTVNLITSPRAKKLPDQYKNRTLIDILVASNQDSSSRSQSFILDMNRLLEVSFMKYRRYMLHVTDDYHLDVLPEYRKAAIRIDGKSSTLAQLQKIHVRQVKKAYVRRKGEAERVFDNEPFEIKYKIDITLEPKRAKRDSSYYVFSPFYQGDF